MIVITTEMLREAMGNTSSLSDAEVEELRQKLVVIVDRNCAFLEAIGAMGSGVIAGALAGAAYGSRHDMDCLAYRFDRLHGPKIDFKLLAEAFSDHEGQEEAREEERKALQKRVLPPHRAKNKEPFYATVPRKRRR